MNESGKTTNAAGRVWKGRVWKDGQWLDLTQTNSVPAAPSAVEEVEALAQRCSTDGEESDLSAYNLMFDKALDLAKRLDATPEKDKP